MNAIMLSIRPQWCNLIANGKKTIEVRKTRPKLETPFKCYIYCTQDKEHTLFKDWIDPPFVVNEYNIMNGKGVKNVFGDNRPWGNANGKVIGEFVCDEMHTFVYGNGGFLVAGDVSTTYSFLAKSCLTHKEFREYAKEKSAYGWHISDLKIYDKPKELSEFYHDCGENPRCDGCPCNYSESNESVGLYEECCSKLEGYRPLVRSPQSWCYVEELA